MGRVEFLKMKTDDEVSANLIESDVNELKVAAKKLNFVKFISWYNIQFTFVEFLLWNLRTQVI